MADTSELKRPVAVRALDPYRIWLRYPDGVEGEVDLSRLADQEAFAVWTQDPASFSGVYVSDSGAVCWSDELDICSDALYMRITGMRPEELFPSLFSRSDVA